MEDATVPVVNFAIARIQQLFRDFFRMNRRLEELLMNQGILLAALNERKESTNLKDYEFKIFSQGGEDGIIQHLIKVLEIKNETFIEFGVEDFSESNCRFLLMNNNWSGFVIDGSPKKIARLKHSYYYWRYELLAIDAFITRENINELLAKSGFEQDLGILSIDLDGNDYYILQAIDFFKPRILICEYNAVFGGGRKISVPYDEQFNRTDKHSSNLYFGASLGAMTHAAKQKGYSLVGTNIAACNAFFVRDDLVNDRLQKLTAEEAFFPSKARESRNKQGVPTFVTGEDRIKLISGMPVVNVETNEIETL
jgi:hypothetical protein